MFPDHEEPVYFVQIGSYNGKDGDPLWPFITERRRWQGILVEPVPDTFDSLQANYANSEPGRLVFENIAISSTIGMKTMYRLSEELLTAALPKRALPEWYFMLNSFDPTHHVRHGFGALGHCLLEEEVPCLSLQSLFELHKVQKLDLLHIDTEGHDGVILSQLNLSRYFPRLVIYEHKHLSEVEQCQLARMFENAGYSLEQTRIDTLAIRNTDKLSLVPILSVIENAL
jgi:FkbM family methyltransferase